MCPTERIDKHVSFMEAACMRFSLMFLTASMLTLIVLAGSRIERLLIEAWTVAEEFLLIVCNAEPVLLSASTSW